MESEERPAKMRKLGHANGDEESPIIDEAALPLPSEQVPVTEESTVTEPVNEEAADAESATPKLSKNQLKKQRRHEQWEAGREDRKVKRKEKAKERKERRREAWKEQTPDENGNIPKMPPARLPRHFAGHGAQVPITVIFDCSWEDLMYDHELKSLGLQITRCYSDNRKSQHRAHLALSSFGGKMKERFDGVLAQQYTSWKGFQFFEEDFVDVANKSKEWMKGPDGGKVAGALQEQSSRTISNETETGDESEEGEIIYLSSESENVLTHLKPNGTYIIGGLVDKNRHKGVCHKRAVERGIKTAKLPIKEYLEMRDRQVLVTNHVLEILLKWMELGDWGKAFMEVMPKRKGGKLKENDAEEGTEASSPETKAQGEQEMVEAAEEAKADAEQEEDGKDAALAPEQEIIETTKGLPVGDMQAD